MEVHMFAIAESTPVPTKLKKVTAVLEPELFAALEAYAHRCKRSLSNQINIILEQALIGTGDLSTPLVREEKRGGRRANAGRKPQVTGDNAAESSAEDSAADADGN
jgi:hypothetical protein